MEQFKLVSENGDIIYVVRFLKGVNYHVSSVRRKSNKKSNWFIR